MVTNSRSASARCRPRPVEPERKGAQAIRAYQRGRNAVSIDGLPAVLAEGDD